MTHTDLDAIQRIALPVLILLPIAASVVVGLLIMASSRYPSERTATRILEVALTISLVLSALVAMGATGVFGAAPSAVVDYGALLELGTYRIPAVLLVDSKGIVFSLLCAFLTLLVRESTRVTRCAVWHQGQYASCRCLREWLEIESVKNQCWRNIFPG